jgi:hypothetical protein
MFRSLSDCADFCVLRDVTGRQTAEDYDDPLAALPDP